MWIRNGVLSDKQFKKHYGRDIYLYPFNEYNLKGASYNLTASRVAYYEENGKLISMLTSKDKIVFPPKKIGYIQTEEAIYITKRICGTYHAKVKWVSKGLSTISTTLDPCYFGTSLMILINHSDKPIEIDVGETFCTVIFHKMTSGHRDLHDNVPFRKDIISGKVYDFSNINDIVKLKERHKLESINEPKIDDVKKEISKYNFKIKNEEDKKIKNKIKIQLKKKNKKLELLLIKDKIRKKEIQNLEQEYKNYLEEWFEEDFRRSRSVLIKKVKNNVEKLKGERREKIISFFLIIFYLLLITYISFIYNGSIFSFLETKKDIDPSVKIEGIALVVAIISFLHEKFVKLIKEIWQILDYLLYKILEL